MIPARFDAKQILVVEDDEDLAKAVVRGLEHHGFATYLATELREGMFRLKNQKFDCVVLDIRLGETSGADLIEFMRERKDVPNRDTPVVVTSGYLDRPLVEKIAHHVKGALVKPYELKTLVDLLKKVTGA